jgi:hypothetical protein
MNHRVNLLTAVERAFAVLSCESTPAEIAQYLNREQTGIIADLERWAHDVIAARPAIQPAREWRSPTEVRRAVAAKTGAAREFVGRKRGRGR